MLWVGSIFVRGLGLVFSTVLLVLSKTRLSSPSAAVEAAAKKNGASYHKLFFKHGSLRADKDYLSVGGGATWLGLTVEICSRPRGR